MRSRTTLIAVVAVTATIGTMLLPAGAGAILATGISGTVTSAATKLGIPGANICAYPEAGSTTYCHPAEPSGNYTIEGLPAGNYRVGFFATNYTSQYYREASTFEEATTVTVTSGSVTPNINAELESATPGTLTGRVTNAANGQGAGGIEVCAHVLTQRCTETNGNGDYTLSGLTPGNNHVEFGSAETCEEEQGVKLRCEPKANILRQSVVKKVTSGKTETLDVTLQPGGQISGTVTNASITHPALGKIEVCASKTGEPWEGYGGCAYTSPTGQYTISGLITGSYKVFFNGSICSIPKKGEEECPEVYVGTWYHAQQTLKKGQAVSVTAGSNTTGIDESLREAFPTTPAATAAPALTGTPAVGQALSCSQGSWSHEPTYLLYQWLRNGTVIAGQAGPTYTVQAADLGHSITCSVLAGNGAGAASASSNALAVPVPIAVFVGETVKGSVVLVTLRCQGFSQCTGTLKLIARLLTRHGRHGALKARNVTIGIAGFSIAPGGTATLHVGLTRTGRFALKRARRRGLKVKMTGKGVALHVVTLRGHR